MLLHLCLVYLQIPVLDETNLIAVLGLAVLVGMQVVLVGQQVVLVRQ